MVMGVVPSVIDVPASEPSTTVRVRAVPVGSAWESWPAWRPPASAAARTWARACRADPLAEEVGTHDAGHGEHEGPEQHQEAEAQDGERQLGHQPPSTRKTMRVLPSVRIDPSCEVGLLGPHVVDHRAVGRAEVDDARASGRSRSMACRRETPGSVDLDVGLAARVR